MDVKPQGKLHESLVVRRGEGGDRPAVALSLRSGIEGISL